MVNQGRVFFKGVFGMKRREEITQTAKNKYPYIKGLPQSTSHQAIFIEAAEWADKTMIEKIRIWVTERYDLDYMGDFKDLLDYIKSL